MLIFADCKCLNKKAEIKLILAVFDMHYFLQTYIQTDLCYLQNLHEIIE